MKKVLGCLGILTVMVMVAVGGGIWWYLHALAARSASAETFAAIHVGEPQNQAKASLPHATIDPGDVYPASDTTKSHMPSHATCDHFLAQDQTGVADGAGTRVYRICYIGGKVVEKKAFVAPQL